MTTQPLFVGIGAADAPASILPPDAPKSDPALASQAATPPANPAAVTVTQEIKKKRGRPAKTDAPANLPGPAVNVQETAKVEEVATSPHA